MPVHPSVIQHLQPDLARDQAAAEDIPGTAFFADPSYLGDLPDDGKALICAIQHVGDSPQRPIFSFAKAIEYYDSWNTTLDIEKLQICCALGTLSIIYTAKNDPDRLLRVHSLAKWLQSRWENLRDPSDMDRSIHFYRQAVFALPSNGSALESYYQTDLAVMLNLRWNRNHSSEDYEAAKESYHAAIKACGQSHLRSIYKSNLGELHRLKAQFSADDKLVHLEEAILCHDEAVSLPLSQIGRLHVARIWRNRGMAHGDALALGRSRDHFLRLVLSYGNAIDNLEKTEGNFAGYLQEMLRICWKAGQKPEPDMIFVITDFLGSNEVVNHLCHSQRLAARGTTCPAPDLARKLLDFATNSTKQIFVRYQNDPKYWEVICWQCSLRLSERYEHFGKAENDDHDLRDAVTVAKLSIRHTGNLPQHSLLFNLSRWHSELLRRSFNIKKDDNDIRLAIKSQEELIESKIGATDYGNLGLSTWLLGQCLKTMFDVNGLEESLVSAATYFRVASLLGQHLDIETRTLIYNDLGNAFCCLFDRSGQTSDLKEAILMYELAIASLRRDNSVGSQKNVRMIFTGLGNAMLRRAIHWTSLEDINAAIVCFRKTLSGVDANDPAYPQRITNLAHALHIRFCVDNDAKHLIEAQRILSNALSSGPYIDAALTQSLFVHMGNTYLYFSSQSKLSSDLNLALRQYNQAASIANGRIRGCIDAAQNSAVAFLSRGKLLNSQLDYQKCLEQLDLVAGLLGSNTASTSHTAMQSCRAKVLQTMFASGDVERGSQSLELHKKLAKDVFLSPIARIHEASTVAMLEEGLNHDYQRAYESILLCVQLMPTAVLLFTSRLEQLRFIRQVHYVPSSAAALAAAAGRPTQEAVHVLEESRTILWNRHIDADDPLTQLRQSEPVLADRLESLRKELAIDNKHLMNETLSDFLAPKDQARISRHEAAELYTSIRRSLVGVEDGSGIEKLANSFRGFNLASKSIPGPLVFVNFSKYRCDAFILSHESSYLRPLSHVNMSTVKENALQLHWALALSKSEESLHQASQKFSQVMSWLWTNVVEPVLDSIDFEVYPKTANGKIRIFWVTTKWISVFPIHASGLEGTEDRCSNRVVSSYIPSLRALEKMSFQPSVEQQDHFKSSALLVAMTETPKMQSLSARKEVDLIELCIREGLKVTVLQNPNFTDVTRHFRSSELIHFACHGVAHPSDPSLSAIRFTDWERKPLTVRAIIGMKLFHCRLVVLSACETAMNKDLLSGDEGLHMAGVFHMAGVQHSVATLWSVLDSVSVKLFADFYTRLQDQKGKLDYSRTAAALDESLQALREEGWPPILLASYVHCGP